MELQQLLPILLWIVFVIAGIIVIRWVLSIDQFIKLYKTQIGLLMMIAKKQGTDQEEIDELLTKIFGKRK